MSQLRDQLQTTLSDSYTLTPPERFVQGTIAVPDRPCFGVALNEKTARAHTM